LAALSAAQELSTTAKEAWAQWRIPLYALWLRRAAQLQLLRQLNSDWVRLAMAAFYGQEFERRGLETELVRHAGEIALATLRDRRVRERISFPVAGLAEINDPAFR
jgi:hypothetical protein